MTIQSVHAGHGGKKNGNAWTDPGAVGNGYKEADVARTITDLMVKKTGAKNVTDNTSTTSNGIINNVAANINKCADGWQISNHLNAFNGKATGVEVLYGSASNKATAAKVSAAIAKTLGLVDRGAKNGSWLGIARNSGSGKKVLLIEWGFIDNASDMKALFAKMDAAVNAALEVMGYKSTSTGGNNTVAKAKYATEKGWYEVIKAGSRGYEPVFDDKERKSEKVTRFPVGTRVYFHEFITVNGTPVARTSMGYMTANLDYVKKVK